MSLDRLKEVIALVANSTIVELKYSEGETHISLVRRIPGEAADATAAGAQPPERQQATPPPEPKPTAVQASAPAPAPAVAAAAEGDDVIVAAPMASVFHRSPSPNADPFVEVGDTCAPGDKLCILEAMKVFTVLDAQCTGTIAEIYAKDGEEVTVDQPLMRIRRQ